MTGWNQRSMARAHVAIFKTSRVVAELKGQCRPAAVMSPSV